ncbi:MarR family winged helix-turn-helix transcriptional regulator [Streptomyces sp. CA-100214]
MSEALRPLGIELRHFAVLIVLVDRGPTVQRDLAAATGTDKAGIMRVVDDLERRNLAVRKAVPGDRRARSVEITPKGWRSSTRRTSRPSRRPSGWSPTWGPTARSSSRVC